ncbi:hypothetical protein MTO96_048197 [Rhipicephalus appendiculatus]
MESAAAASPTKTNTVPLDGVISLPGRGAPTTVSFVDTAAPTGTIPPANAVSPRGPAAPAGSNVAPVSAQYPADVAALVNSARALLSPPNSRPTEADSRRSSVASVAAALVFKPKTRRWRMNESSRAVDSSAPEPSTRSLNSPALLIVFCSGLLILVFFSVFVGTSKTGDKKLVCDTSDCRLHRYILESGLDQSIDPCDNFSAYVCANWKPRHRSARSALSDMLYEWLNDLPERLRRGATQLPTTTKAISMFDVCMNQVDSTADVVLSFLRDRGLEWQNDSSAGSLSPAEVLLDLAFNWKSPLWFRIQMLPKSPEHPHQRRLLFTPNDLISQWAPFFNDINEQLYIRYWTLFHRQLSSGHATPSANAAINESFHVQRFVFDALLRAATNRNKKPTVLPLKALTDYPELSSAGFVMDVINRTLGLAQESPDDEAQLLISDQVYLDAVREIVRRLSVSELKRHLAWLFVQTHGVVADPGRLLFALFGEKSRARQERPLFCAAQVESSYKLLVAAADSVTRFTVKERRVISDRLADVQAAVKKTQGSLWLDVRTKAAAVDKFSKVKIVLWPRDEFLTEDALDRAFQSFLLNGTASLAQLWEDTRLIWHALRDTSEGNENDRLPYSYTQPYARYWYLLNTVRLSLGLLAQPAYYSQGTRAMLFGGLGFLFARELVRAVDGSGVGLDSTGKPVAGSWMSDSTARVNFEKRLRCEEDLFPDVPAVEVAFAAFLDGSSGDSNDLRLSRRFSEPQVFFLTLCHLACVCSHHDNLYGADCNRVVRNFQPFADAFRCAPGSKMNPTDKCRFFG